MTDTRQDQRRLEIARAWLRGQGLGWMVGTDVETSLVHLLTSREAAVLEEVRTAYLRWLDTRVPQAGNDQPPIQFEDWLLDQAQERRS